MLLSELAGDRGGALTRAPRPTPPGEISAPRPAPPGAPGLARADRPSRPPGYRVTIPGSTGWPILPRPDPRTGLVCPTGAARRARAASQACARCRARAYAAALARIRAWRWHAVLHATRCSGIMDDAVLVCIREMSHAARYSLSHAYVFGISPQAAAATHFLLEEIYTSFSVVAGASLLRTSE